MMRGIARIPARAVRATLRRLGLSVHRHRPGYGYGPDYYGGNFKKKVDIRTRAPFAGLAERVVRDGTTKLGHDRLFTLYQAILAVRSLIEEGVAVAEVGVFRGGSSYFIASAIDEVLGQAPPIHCFDTFEGHPDDIAPGTDGHHRPGDLDSTSGPRVREYLGAFPHVTVHQGRVQDTCESVAGERFCLVHVDVDIYTGTRDSLAFFDRVLLPGGVIVLDDYGFTTCPGVKRALGEFLEGRADYRPFELLTGQAILVRL
jgi:hypothetical protein